MGYKLSRIARLVVVESIKPGEPPDIAPDGTILNPEPYYACNVTLNDGITVQVERPLTLEAIRAAYEIALANPEQEVDRVREGDELPPAGPP